MKEKICKHKNNVLGYRMDFYFHDYKLAMEMNKSTEIFTIKSKEKNQQNMNLIVRARLHETRSELKFHC